MNEQFTQLRRKFNNLKSRWATSGNMAKTIHAHQMSYPHIPSPHQFDFTIGSHNKDKFIHVLRLLGYEFITMKSSRRNLRFEKKNHVPVNLHLVDIFPNVVMSHDSKIPLQKLETLPNVNRLLKHKRKLQSIVNIFKINNLNNVN